MHAAIFLYAALSGALWGQAEPPLIRILTEEMDRNFKALKEKADPAPYFISYEVTDQESYSISGTLGSLQSSNRNRGRFVDVSVRVGEAKLDNYRRIRGDLPQFTSGSQISMDDTPAAIKQRLWLETDRVYRLGAQRLINIKTNQQVKLADTDKSGDFSSQEPAKHFAEVSALKFSVPDWEAKVRKWSGELSGAPSVLSSTVIVTATREMKYFVSTEGTRLAHGRNFARIVLSAQGKAFDGMNLSAFDSIETDDPTRLPDEKKVREAVDRVSQKLTALLKAKVVEPYVGPALLSGKAAGVFFHEIFGHRVEGHRQKEETEGQTFAKSVGQPILPEFLSVEFDPTRKQWEGVDLNGWYDYDDEGVKARPVKVVENGILKGFLMSRSPIDGFPESNGHGRKQPGSEVVSRQSNMIVRSSKPVPFEKLRQMLIDEVKRQNKPFGLYFAEVSSGFTMTQRRGLQAFSVVPTVVYRVYPDGRPDELVRGADMVGTPLASFAKILATSSDSGVFNGYCGAESGSVPVSAIAPALLVQEVEIQKKERSQETPPILDRPARTGGKK